MNQFDPTGAKHAADRLESQYQAVCAAFMVLVVLMLVTL